MMRKLKNTLIAVLLALWLIVPSDATDVQTAIASASHEPAKIDRYLNIRGAFSPQLSPDGNQLAFLTTITGTRQVWMVKAEGGWPAQMTFYTEPVDFVTWSPSGTGLIFAKAFGGDENAQLFWLAPDGSNIRALTDAPKVRHNFGSWSHDGKKISYASNQRHPNFFDIYVMDVTSGREELVYQQDGANSAVAWSFDDRQLIVLRDSEQFSLDNDLYLIDIATKQATHLTPHTGPAQFNNVYFTGDGRSLILGTDNGREFLALARMDLPSKKITIIDDVQWSMDETAMSNDGSMFAYTINRDGFSELYIRKMSLDGKLGPKSSPIKLPAQGVVRGLEFSADNRQLAFVFNSARYNPDVWLYNIKNAALSQVTHSSRAGIPQSSFIEPKLIHYKTFDGREIPAWYYRPQATAKTQSSRPLPVIVSVHGGPEAQELAIFNPIYQYFLSRGYAVLAPNVRGSTGYGKTYTHLDDVRKREDSVKDLAAAVEWLKLQGEVDPQRIAVMGGSYGGYMTLAAITLYPNLWAAAIDTVGIANFESFLAKTSGYRRQLREVEYGSLERDRDFLRSISPIYKVDRIRTPLMVIQGKNDPRVPYTEAEQIVKSLRARNLPVDYTLFEDEGHGIAKLKNRLIIYPKVADFLARYMK